jgi:hypothetical protein
MKTSRRELAAMVALGGAGMAMTPARAATQPQLVHHVFFWLKRPGSKEDRDLLVAGLRTLRDIPVIRRLLIGLPASTEKRDVVDASYDVSELMYFDNAEDQKSYQDHPLHLAFVKSCGELWEKVVVYDMAVIAE